MNLFGRKSGRTLMAAGPEDEQAIARYRYLLRTAPPEALEQAHAEAFAQLTPDQRRLLLERMGESVPASERALAGESAASPQALARLATRAEMRQPGAVERMFRQAGGASLGGLMAGTLLSSIAGAVIGSAIAREFFSGAGDEAAEDPGLDDSADAGGFDAGGFDV